MLLLLLASHLMVASDLLGDVDMHRDSVELAKAIAERAHAGQVDKAGAEYIAHPRRVAEIARSYGSSDEAIAAAWLHDVLEDTSVTADDLRRAGIPEEVIAAVESVTKRSGERLEDYCARVRANPLALRVKRADLDDNTDLRRIAALPEKTRQRLAAKYARMRSLLGLTPLE